MTRCHDRCWVVRAGTRHRPCGGGSPDFPRDVGVGEGFPSGNAAQCGPHAPLEPAAANIQGHADPFGSPVQLAGDLVGPGPRQRAAHRTTVGEGKFPGEALAELTAGGSEVDQADSALGARHQESSQRAASRAVFDRFLAHVERLAASKLPDWPVSDVAFPSKANRTASPMTPETN